MKRLLIKNACIITLDPRLGDISQGDILVEEDVITEIGRDLDATDAETIDALGKIAIPGLINAHIHTWQAGLKGIGGNWTSVNYHEHVHRGIAMAFSPEDTYLGNFVGALSQINAGSTTILDWCHVNATPDHTDRAIDGLQETGIRALFAHGTVKPKQLEGQKHFSEIPHPRSEIERLRRGRLASDDALITLGMAILGPENSTREVMLQDFALAREYGLTSSSHTWNRKNRICKEGFYPVAEAQMLGPDHNIVHGNYLVDDELKMLVDHGVSVTATPTVELQSAKADPLCGRVKQLGNQPSLGSDTEVFAAGDMFHTMRLALQYQHAIDCRSDANDQMPTKELGTLPREALEWATIAGARAMRMENQIGSLSPGKKADIVLLDVSDICLQPVHDPVSSVVLFADRSNVDTVIIDGRIQKRHGVLSLSDDLISRRQASLKSAMHDTFERAGFTPAEQHP